MNEYAIVTGQGRSGSNWVLDMLDASRETICRNEPNVVHGSPFENLTPLWRMVDDACTLDMQWDSVAERTCRSLGDRDHRIVVNKNYLHTWAHRAGLPPLMARPKIRTILARTVLPRLGEHNWTLPRVFGSQERLGEAYGIIKVNRVPQLVHWALDNRPDVPVVNIVRHPGGRHASYLRRFLSDRDAEIELGRVQATLRQIAADDEQWAQRFGDIDALGVAGSQTWLWRFVNETIADAGAGKAMYKQVVFERMVADPVLYAQQIYDLLGLDWTPEVEASVVRGRTTSVWGRVDPDAVADAWRDTLERSDIDVIEEILSSSPLASLWQ